MKKFRLPRKIKKSLKGKMHLYPADEKGNSQVAFPCKYQKDYDAYKQGKLRDLFADSKAERKAYREKLDKETTVSDAELKRYVNDILREEYRATAYDTLKKAKNNPNTIIAYYNFVNAYQLYEKDGSYSTVCCMAVDHAEKLLKKEFNKIRNKK